MGVTEVIFALETTGFTTKDAIFMISAVPANGKTPIPNFSRYVTPTCAISDYASAQTAVTKCLRDEVEVLKTPSGEFSSSFLDQKNVLEDFLTFLEGIRASATVKVTLVSHDCFKAHAEILAKALRSNGLEQRSLEVISGFCDTKLLARETFPNLLEYSLAGLMRQFLNRVRSVPTDALSEALGLRDLVREMDLSIPAKPGASARRELGSFFEDMARAEATSKSVKFYEIH